MHSASMHSTETARRSQRRKPELNINTAASMKTIDAIPITPPARSQAPPLKGNLKNPAPRPALKVPNRTLRDTTDVETFLDSITPVDMSNKENDRPDRPEHPRPSHRDSHDLSLPARQVTRDSLVANMLLSLDQLSMGQMNGSIGGARGGGGLDDPTYPSFGGDDSAMSMTFNSRSGGRGGHGYTYSSDLEGGDDSSRISSQPSRGRRSNSSSGFQSSLGRINSMRDTTQRGSQPGTPRPLHSRGGKGSKSSSTNSIDTGGYVQVLSSQRWGHAIGGRSSSFDYGNGRTATVTSTQSPWHIEFSNTFLNDEYDAAPTPTVPGGPRRLAAVPSMPVLPPPEPKNESKSPERKRSTRSARSATVGRKDAPKFNNRDAPPVPAFDLDSAPAPHVGYEKSKETVQSGPNSTSHAKEKPGFFRRVFGSSRNNSFTQESSSAYVSSGSVETVDRPNSKSKPQSAPPSRESHHSATHTLQKKTSSFFRRRKQSVSEAERPPPPPLPPAPAPPIVPPIKLAVPQKRDLLSPKPDPSPVTSLRRAMNPYLKGSPDPASGGLTPESAHSPVADAPATVSTRQENEERDQDRNVRGFSPDYEPSPSAVIRTVEPEISELRDVSSSGGVSQKRLETPSRQPPEPPNMARAGSFLHDNSDSEESPPRQVTKRESMPRLDEPVLRTSSSRASPASVSPRLDRPRPSHEDLNSHTVVSAVNERDSDHGDEDDDHGNSTLALPIEGVVTRSNGASTEKVYQTASSVPSVKVESSEPSPKLDAVSSSKTLDEPEFVVGDPTEDDRQKAQRIFDGNEDFIQREKAAAWMGEEGPVRQRTLRAYMDLYGFTNQSILKALRQVCGRLVFRAETQQVDRILVAFSARWCECNPHHGFKATDVIHTICYSIMLLNTDLHLADIEQKMTRSQFVKNTMTTIKHSLVDSAPEAFDRRSALPERSDTLAVGDGRVSGEQDRTYSFRASFKPPPRMDSSNTTGGSSERGAADDCGPLVKAPFDGPLRNWESQVEVVLKEVYTSIRDERLPLFGAESRAVPATGGLNVKGMLKRTPSVLSKAPSETMSSTRGRIAEAAHTGSRWASKSRSRPRPFAPGFSSSRTSFDDANSIWSPTESSATWSRQSLGRTQTSFSMDSFGSSWPRREFQQSIGFANALSQAIIREDALGSPSILSDDLKGAQLLEDESLELAGEPWVKEGIVTHKHHLDGIDKKAKDRNWHEVFAVIQKGYLSLFSFSPNKSLRSRARARTGVAKGAVVGGGNWQENATSLGSYSLRQALASAMPPPGYSRQRPHVWVLSLPTGAVHLFQVGTPEIIKEFVNTSNYWSARLSTHPLVGGISNIEYGWSEAIVNNALVNAINESTRPGTATSGATKGHSRPGSDANASIPPPRTSIQSRGSVRSSSLEQQGRPGSGTSSSAAATPGSHSRGRLLPGDRIHIAEWSAPQQSMRPSNAAEGDQLATLLSYVRGIEEELTAHNALRSPMLLAFTPRGANSARAMANWTRKSEYLLKETVKFRTYVDCLQMAERRREEIYQEREERRPKEALDHGEVDAPAVVLVDDDVDADSAHEEGEGMIAREKMSVDIDERNGTLGEVMA